MAAHMNHTHRRALLLCLAISISLLALASLCASALAASDTLFNDSSQTVSSNSGSTQLNRLSRDGTASSCAAPHTQSLLSSSGTLHYHGYYSGNGIDQSTCVTVAITTSCSSGNSQEIYSAAYTSFTSSDPSKNQLGVEGNSPPAITSYSFTAPSMAGFDVIVHEVTANTGCSDYSIAATTNRPFATLRVRFAGDGVKDHTVVGQTLQIRDAAWVDAPTVSQQWYRCDGSGASCNAMSGVTGTSYTVLASDVGSTFRVIQTAHDASGTSTSTSLPTGTAVAVPPAPVYSVSSHGGATLNPVPDFTGLSSDDDTKALSLPFPVSFYGQTYGAATIGANGNLQFATSNRSYFDSCAPNNDFAGPTVMALQRDLLTNGATQAGEGVYTGLSGPAGSRVFDIEWVAENINDNGPDTFAIRLYENSLRISLIYGTISDLGATGTVGVQSSPLAGTQFSCDTAKLSPGTEVDFDPQLPSISGTPGVGQPLTATNATWSGTGPIAFAYAWQRCNSSGTACGPTGTAGTGYTPSDADRGSTLRVVVTAGNSAGSASLTSPPSAVVPPAPASPNPPSNPNHGTGPKPTLAFLATAGLPAFDGKRIAETIACGGTAGSCSGVLSATAPGATKASTAAKHKRKHRKPAPMTLAGATFTIPAGHSQTVRATLTGAALRALAKRHRLAATVTVSLRGSTGALTKVSTHQLTLIAKKPNKHRRKR